MVIEPYIEKDFARTEPFTGINSIEEELKEKQFLVVMESPDEFQGVLTIADVFERRKRLVIDCLTPKPSLFPDSTIHQALEIMHSSQIPVLPVIDRQDKFCGILSIKRLKESFDIYEKDRTSLFKKKLSLSEKIKEQFFRNLSHEIRTPLNAIQGLTEVLLYSDIPETEKRNFAGMLHAKTDELLTLIDSLLNLSRLEAGDLSISPDEDVSPWILFSKLKEKAFNLKETYHREKVEIRASVRLPENFVLKTNLAYMQEIMLHLISNGLKYTEAGVVEFGCYLDSSERPVFFVRDTGAGISPENQKAVFEAFSKVEKEGTINQGLGIGLTLVAKIVQASGGHIWLESEPGKGSCFRFFLGNN